MSKAENHLEWCLRKAKKELETSRKHRGLIRIKTDDKKAELHIEKANHNLKALLYFEKGGFSDWTINAAFYSLYHCFLAILAKHGYESKNQECTISAIEFLMENKTISLDKKFIEALKYHTDIKDIHEQSVIELRENYQYGVEKEIEDKNEIGKLSNLCLELIDAAKDEIYKPNKTSYQNI